jgi:hypothetical protein
VVETTKFFLERCTLPWNVEPEAFATSLADEIAKYPIEVIQKLRDPAAGVLARMECLKISAIARESERLMMPIRARAQRLGRQADFKQYIENAEPTPEERDEMNAKIAAWRAQHGIPEGGLLRDEKPTAPCSPIAAKGAGHYVQRMEEDLRRLMAHLEKAGQTDAMLSNETDHQGEVSDHERG